MREPSVVPDERGGLLRRALALEYVTISYNVGEAVLSVLAGLLAGSIALLGFGFDSMIEVAAAAFVALRLRAEMKARHADHSGRERQALRAVGVTFVVLAAYILLHSSYTLVAGDRPESSVPGILIAVASLVTMPVLGTAKLRVARRLGSEALEADAWETFVCAYLSSMLLVGLALNAALGWWWADPVGGLLMTPFVLYQGWDALTHASEGHEGPNGARPPERS